MASQPYTSHETFIEEQSRAVGGPSGRVFRLLSWIVHCTVINSVYTRYGVVLNAISIAYTKNRILWNLIGTWILPSLLYTFNKCAIEGLGAGPFGQPFLYGQLLFHGFDFCDEIVDFMQARFTSEDYFSASPLLILEEWVESENDIASRDYDLNRAYDMVHNLEHQVACDGRQIDSLQTELSIFQDDNDNLRDQLRWARGG